MNPSRPMHAVTVGDTWAAAQAIRAGAAAREARAARLRDEVDEAKARAAEPGAVVPLRPKAGK